MIRRDENMEELQELNQLSSKNPMVLSCGGIFIPRPRLMSPNDEVYKILNIANEKEPTKVVCGSFNLNLLQDVLHKESLN